MPFTKPNFPILTLEQSNPFTAALSSALSTYGKTQDFQKAGLDIEKQRQLLPFVKPQAEAELLAKQQANKWNPSIWQSEIGLRGAQAGLAKATAGLTNEQAKQLQYFAAQGYPTDDMRMFMLLQNARRTSATGASPGSSLSNLTTTSGGGGNVERDQRIADSIATNQKNVDLDRQIYSGYNPDIFSQYEGLTPEAAAFWKKKYGNSPEAEYQQNIAQEDIKRNNKIMEDKMPALDNLASTGINLVNTSEKLANLYDKISVAKGGLGGFLPSRSPEATEFDKRMQQLINQNAIVNANGGKAFGYNFSAAAGEKVSRAIPEDAFNALINSSIAQGQENVEKQAFYSSGGSKRPYPISAEMLDKAWNVYKRHRPTFNNEPGQYYKNNAFMNTWQDYLTPEALRSIAEKGDYIPPNQKQLKQQNITSSDINKFKSALNNIDPRISKLMATRYIEYPDLLSDEQFEKIKNKIPPNVLLQMIKSKILLEGGS